MADEVKLGPGVAEALENVSPRVKAGVLAAAQLRNLQGRGS